MNIEEAIQFFKDLPRKDNGQYGLKFRAHPSSLPGDGYEKYLRAFKLIWNTPGQSKEDFYNYFAGCTLMPEFIHTIYESIHDLSNRIEWIEQK